MVLGYLLAVFIGISLGLLGGGGSILTVPILVYAMDMDPKLAIALSLAIVGTTSLIGVWRHKTAGNVAFKKAFVFAGSAMLGTFLGAKASVFFTGEFQLGLFAVIMLLASFFMLRPVKMNETGQKKDVQKWAPLLISAFGVGILTGLVGVGGGFLIVPALVFLGGVNMKKAVGTSLLVISLNSFSGFAGYISLLEIPCGFLLKFTSFSILGVVIGSYAVKFVSQEKLKVAFGVFLILMGAFIIYQNLGF